ncbi:uncharacterized protein RB166_003094 [Leptodactylus fuscus]|uniref:uncharacterized protein LOC142194011 n=1 Tax=Leptodactylus fuscus TaxID=238119 RepID=UPI003F4F3D9F
MTTIEMVKTEQDALDKDQKKEAESIFKQVNPDSGASFVEDDDFKYFCHLMSLALWNLYERSKLMYEVYERARSTKTSKEHFVDRHRLDLIRGVTLVDPILDDLYQRKLLIREAYDRVRSLKTSQEKMRELLNYSQSWGNEDKDHLLESLTRHNPLLIINLLVDDTVEDLFNMISYNFYQIIHKLYEQRSSTKMSKEHFVDGHRVDLIRRVTLVDPILDDLYQRKLLIREAYDRVRSLKTSQEKMRELLSYVESWGNEDKDQFLESLRRHNPLLINTLEVDNFEYSLHLMNLVLWNHFERSMLMYEVYEQARSTKTSKEHFVDRHLVDLMRRVTLVDPILDDLYQRKLLIREAYNRLRSLKTSQEKMRDKDQLLESLRRHNPLLIMSLEAHKIVEDLFNMMTPISYQFYQLIHKLYERGSSTKMSKEHFVDKHRVDLIRRVTLVDPILDDLYQRKLLIREAYDRVRSLKTSQEKMRELLSYVESWGNEDKDHLLESLRKHHSPLMRRLEGA